MKFTPVSFFTACFYWKFRKTCPAGIYLLKVNNRNTRTRCGICSKLTIKIPERRHSSVSIVNFEHVIAGSVVGSRELKSHPSFKNCEWYHIESVSWHLVGIAGLKTNFFPNTSNKIFIKKVALTRKWENNFFGKIVFS